MFTGCTNSCSKGQKKITQFNVSMWALQKFPNFFAWHFILCMQLWWESEILKSGCTETHTGFMITLVSLRSRSVRLCKVVLDSEQTQEVLNRHHWCSYTSHFWRRGSTSDCTKFSSLCGKFFSLTINIKNVPVQLNFNLFARGWFTPTCYEALQTILLQTT